MSVLLNGIIPINKPADFTSFDVAAILRHSAGTRKIGHGGTLDPMATGVLPMFIGRATKAADLNPCTDKSYKAGFRFGVSTETEDVWGEIINTDDTVVSYAALSDAVLKLTGDIMQTPPMYSAVKINGKKLYEYARKGITIERPSRPITVYELTILSYDEKKREGSLFIRCSKGTYIRTIISELGAICSTGGIMTSLVRTHSGGFDLSDCADISDIRGKTPEEIEHLVIPTEHIFKGFPALELDRERCNMFLNGIKLDTKLLGIESAEGDSFRIKDSKGVFLGLARDGGDGLLKQYFLNIV